ncbi:MAG TPA: hypothetical protein VK797_22925 [Tepidisphaeraceae bacterium]|nr:hypothetical protein [Tepidisphaeraceae bacterium]
MNVAGFFPLHYGKAYLREAVEALAPCVDRIVVVYAPRPSYGQAGDLPNPDSEEELRACFDPPYCSAGQLDWHRGDFPHEGLHRQAGYDLCREAGADLVVQCDGDEVWDTEALARAIARALESPAAIFPIRGPSWIHFWRSFAWCCRDVWTPTRLLRPDRCGPGAPQEILDGRIYHFGYAVPEALMRYKWSCHGHKSELRPGWIEDIFCKWPERKKDVHPCVYDWWNVEPFAKDTLPDSLKRHPWYELEVIP